METQTTFCCTSQPLPTSASKSYLLTSFLQTLFIIFHPQIPAPLQSGSHPPPSTSTSSSLLSSTSTYYTARSQPLPSSTSSDLRPPEITLFPRFPKNKKLPRIIIELETIRDVHKHTRYFFHRYFAELEKDSHEKNMFPEENFAEIRWEDVEARWRRGQEYRVGQSWVGGRVTEWARREDMGELGRTRVGWVCRVHGWGFWIRVLRWEDVSEIEE
jgi:hypothetical protein